MAEPGRERRQQALHVFPSPVPILHAVEGGGVAQRMQAWWPSSVAARPDVGCLEQIGECGPDSADRQRHPVPACQEGRGQAIRQRELPAPDGVGLQRLGQLVADRNQAVLEELGLAYGQHRVLEIDIADGQAQRLAETKTGPIEQQQECPHGSRIKLNRALAADIDDPEQTLQFVTGEDMGRCRYRPPRLVLGRRKRRAGGMAAADRVLPETGQCPVFVGAGPGERTRAGQEAEHVDLPHRVAASVLADMPAELKEQPCALVELRTMSPPPVDIGIGHIQEGHVRSSRLISPTSRNAPICTFA